MKSIAQILGSCIEELQGAYISSMLGGGFAQLNAAAFSCAKKIARQAVEYFIAETDKALREEPERKRKYTVERNGQTRVMQTEYGELKIERTLYQNKEDGSYQFLVDEVLGIEKYERIEDNLKVKLLEAASETSYGKAEKVADGAVSRQTVMNLVHRLKEIKAVPSNKRNVNDIYIEADEDHIHMQDGRSGILKLIYVHEGTEEVHKGRKKLINPWFFTSIEKDSENLWYEVMDYVERIYDTETAEITLRGDGGNWIESGREYFKGAKFELDSFHMFKSITRATGHCRALRGRIIDSIRSKDYELTQRLYEQLYAAAQKDSDRKETQDSMSYVLNHFDDIATFAGGGGCSAEGHVSHMLSARLSSRPMGWSKRGAANIAALRAFTRNGGDMLSLVKRGRPAQTPFAEKTKNKKLKLPDIKSYPVPILSASSNCKTKFIIKKLIS